MQRFNDRVVLVTGSASGIGRACAERMGSEGGKIACVDINQQAAEDTAVAIRAQGGEAFALACDVGDAQAVKKTVASVIDHYGKLNALCNVAGILSFANTLEVKLEDWLRVLQVNLTGTFLMCQTALPHLIETKGAIVNLSSTAALAGHPWTAAYSASKGGVLALTHTLAVEFGKKGVRVNALCPGSIKTPIFRAFQMPEGADQSLLSRILPFDGEFRPPENVAAMVALLASDEGAHINGTSIRIDGGMLA